MLNVENLSVQYHNNGRVHHAVKHVSFSVCKGQHTAIIGESGCGKSSLATALLRLHRYLDGAHVSGHIFLNGNNIMKMNDCEMNNILSKDISLIFQDLSLSLDPVMTVGKQIENVLKIANSNSGPFCRNETFFLLKNVGLTPENEIYKKYPHQLSGGMRQRVLLAIALANNPDVIIADEPTSSLDMVLQDEIMRLLFSFCQEKQATLLFITHDLSLAFQYFSRFIIMYNGQIVEIGASADILKQAQHPYTKLLLNAFYNDYGQSDTSFTSRNGQDSGCIFYAFCNQRKTKCLQNPPLISVSHEHKARCWFIDEETN